MDNKQAEQPDSGHVEKITGLDYTPGFSPRIARLTEAKREKKEANRRRALSLVQQKSEELWPDEGSAWLRKHNARLRWAFVHGAMWWRHRDAIQSFEVNAVEGGQVVP